MSLWTNPTRHACRHYDRRRHDGLHYHYHRRLRHRQTDRILVIALLVQVVVVVGANEDVEWVSDKMILDYLRYVVAVVVGADVGVVVDADVEFVIVIGVDAGAGVRVLAGDHVLSGADVDEADFDCFGDLNEGVNEDVNADADVGVDVGEDLTV